LSLLLISRKTGFQFTDAVYWTLAIEAEFYLLIAVSFWLFRERFWIGVLAGTIVGLTGRYMGFFLIGMSAYYLYNNHFREGALLGAVGLVKFCLYWMHLQIADGLYITLSIGALLVAVFLLHRQTGPVAWLGRISYPLYLLHANIGLGIIDLCTLNGIPLCEGLALATSFSIALAALIHYAVEMPANAALRRVLPPFPPAPKQFPVLCQKVSQLVKNLAREKALKG
jgi:peptidoglycan/LPS O-acetylase OafA/YrhL